MRVVNNAPGLLSTTKVLTAAQLRAIHTTPVTLIPAPGAGRIIAVDSIAQTYNFGTNGFDSQAALGAKVVYASVPGTPLLDTPTFLLTAGSSSFAFSNSVITQTVFAQSTIANQAVQLTAIGDYNAGPILTATLGAGGAGYAANDTGIISQNNNDATYKVLTVDGAGAVLTFQITGNGTQYVTANGVPTATGGAQPGVGVGFTVNITAVTLGDGTLKVVTYYQIVPVP